MDMLERRMVLLRPFPEALLDSETLLEKLQREFTDFPQLQIRDRILEFAPMAKREIYLTKSLAWLDINCESLQALRALAAVALLHPTQPLLHECTVHLESWSQSQRVAARQELQRVSDSLDEMMEDARRFDEENDLENYY
ncbi:unknown protein [Seminavis robusta]|uniref:Uncharacterized protein n=1 Tax=Seminavis robusta TaxID=568900 RepID=A0A9N8HH09_9STRA|nr:unknown protein [Seminavis robusta]|eukprot:Sro425_g140060.1 n/a (140) ;mRNA; f:1975-2394